MALALEEFSSIGPPDETLTNELQTLDSLIIEERVDSQHIAFGAQPSTH
jgi:hypothetical protein